MFDWLKPKSECPVGPGMRAWLDSRVVWIIRQFGLERLRRVPVVLPTSEFFPGKYLPTREHASRLFEQVCRYMDVAPNRIDLRFYKNGESLPSSWDDSRAAGLYRECDGADVIQLEESQLADPISFVATAAHELAHVHLLSDHRLGGDEHDNEPLTDLLTVFLGLGVFTANAASRCNVFLGLVEGRPSARQGYLRDTAYAYAHAAFAWLRNEDRPHWARFLRPILRQEMLSTLRWFAEIDEQTGLPRGSQYDRSSLEHVEPAHFPRGWVPSFFEALPSDERVTDSELDPFAHAAFELSVGHFEEAVRELTVIIGRNPDDAEAHQTRALAYLGWNKPEEALADAERAMDLSPEDDESRFVRGKARVFNSLHELALSDLNAVIKDRGIECRGDEYFHRGLARAALGDVRASIKDFTKAITESPMVEYYEARATAYEQLGKTSKAKRDYERAECLRGSPPTW